MSYAYQAAEKAFITAQNNLEMALEKFNVARDEFAKVSGKFIATDINILNSIKKFSHSPRDNGVYTKAEL